LVSQKPLNAEDPNYLINNNLCNLSAEFLNPQIGVKNLKNKVLNIKLIFGMMNWRILIYLLLLTYTTGTQAQTVKLNPELMKDTWPAYWITMKASQQKEYGIYHFRKNFEIKAIPSSFPIHVSGDNRYRLFINGTPICSGPARGDLFNWYFETVDIAPYLVRGKNTLAAIVWNMGQLAPVAQVSNQTALLIQGNSDAEKIVNTDSTWKVIKSNAYTPTSLDNQERLQAYMVVGPGDHVDGSKYSWNWQDKNYNDNSWANADQITHAEPVGHGTDNRWTLAPRTIPLMLERKERFAKIRRATSIKVNDSFIKGVQPITIAPNQKVSILLDVNVNNVAYPELIVSAGTSATVKMTYAESLFDGQGKKGNRNAIENKEIKGNYDMFVPDGGQNRKFRPIWFRAYRYLQLDIITKNDPLILNDIYNMRTGYPLALNASFSSNDVSLSEIWQVGWRTARLCAGEMYYDTPYYEQLQYTGDSRIQALISLYNSGDDRLMRKSILDFYHSRTPEGLTQGRYPSNRLQIIPTFSLFWVSMVHDYWMHRKDDAFIKQFLPAINEIMEWYKARTDQDKKMLGPLTWWNFVDWDNFDSWGVPDGVEKGNSAIITLQYSYTLNQAADLVRAYQNPAKADEYKAIAAELNASTISACYNTDKGLLADTPEQKTYSQHAGIWAILSGAMTQDQMQPMLKRLLNDKNIGQVTFFYRFYLIQALKKAGLADLYYQELNPWREMLKLGLTTFAEKPEPTRSDCHAWSASPNYDFLATICGIMPAAPGFEQVLIKPALGELTKVSGTMPHPYGKIAVRYNRRVARGITAEITLPERLTGTFIWNGQTKALHSGKQIIVL
jgi:alpha-L-rhamnosidase